MAPVLSVGKHHEVLGMSKAPKRPKDIAATLNFNLAMVYKILNRARARDGILVDKP